MTLLFFFGPGVKNLLTSAEILISGKDFLFQSFQIVKGSFLETAGVLMCSISCVLTSILCLYQTKCFNIYSIRNLIHRSSI